MKVPLIFTHYGNPDYLSRTLRQASQKNPSVRKILLGDTSNMQTAHGAGWEHVFLDDMASSERDLFNARFRWVQGPKHSPIKGGQDWLRYVSERFFCLKTLLRREGIDYFWHFDSDVMILHDLQQYCQHLLDLNIDCSTLCNDCCPSGFISASFIDRYCSHMIRLYEDREWLKKKDVEFSFSRIDQAFTEMEAFCLFRDVSACKTIQLSDPFLADGIWFDAAICLDEGRFKMASVNRVGYSKVKYLSARKGKIYGQCNASEVEMAIVNCSWVGNEVYNWIAKALALGDEIVIPLDEFLMKNAQRRLPSLVKKKCGNLIAELRDVFRH